MIESLVGVPILQIQSGLEHTLVLTKLGQIYSFGKGNYGALGHSSSNDERIPKRIDFFTSYFIEKISVGNYHNVVLSKESRVFSFGRSLMGELGHPDITNNKVSTPKLITKLLGLKIIDISCGNSHSVFIVKIIFF